MNKRELSPAVALFMRNLTWSAAGGLTAAALMFGASVLAGRLLGPAQFGNAALVVTIAQLFSVFAPLGFDIAGSRRLPRVTSDAAAAKTASSAALVIIPVAAAACVFGIALAPSMSALFDIRSSILVAGIAYGFVLVIRTSADRLLSGAQRFRRQSLARPLEGAVAVTIIVVATSFGGDSWRVYVGALLAGGLLAGIALWGGLRDLIRWRFFDREETRELGLYGRVTLVHALTPVGFVYADKFVASNWLGSGGLGVYAAYYAAGSLIVAQALAVVSNVLFPASAVIADRRSLTRRLYRLAAIGYAPAVLALTVIVRLLLAFYGKGFAGAWSTSFYAAAWGALLLFNGLLTTNAITHSRRAYLWVASFQGARSIAYIILVTMLILTDRLSVNTMLLCLVAVEVLDSWNLHMINKRVVCAVDAS